MAQSKYNIKPAAQKIELTYNNTTVQPITSLQHRPLLLGKFHTHGHDGDANAAQIGARSFWCKIWHDGGDLALHALYPGGKVMPAIQPNRDKAPRVRTLRHLPSEVLGKLEYDTLGNARWPAKQGHVKQYTYLPRILYLFSLAPRTDWMMTIMTTTTTSQRQGLIGS